MDENKIAAAILTFALWNSREKTTAKQATQDDWKYVIDDYTTIVAELCSMDRQAKS